MCHFLRYLDWKCMECGRLMTLRGAERAVSEGCPRCGGSDIDVAPIAVSEHANVIVDDE